MGGNSPWLALIQGIVRHIQWTPREIEAYITGLEKVLRRYVQRLQWLLSGESARHPGGWERHEGKCKVNPGDQGQSFPGRCTNCQVKGEARSVIQVQHDFWVPRSGKLLDVREVEHGPKGTRENPDLSRPTLQGHIPHPLPSWT